MADKPTMLTMGLANNVLRDAKFHESLPEFSAVRQQNEQLAQKAQKGKGCGGCRRRRQAANLYTMFVNTALQLNGDAQTRFRAYFGGEVRIPFQDPKTKKFATKTI